MPPVLTDGGERCSRLFGEVGHYASDCWGVSNGVVKEMLAAFAGSSTARHMRRPLGADEIDTVALRAP